MPSWGRARRQYCNLCGQPLIEEAHHYAMVGSDGPGLVVCATCEAQARRCQTCRTPMARESRGDYCASCRAHYPACSGCGAPVVRVGYRRQGHPELYCQTCYRFSERCTVCGIPLVREAAQLSDGTKLCAACGETAVTDLATAQVLFAHVMGLVATQLKLSVHRVPDLQLTDRRHLDALLSPARSPTGSPGPDLMGGHLLGVYVKQGQQRSIWVERGLPKLLMTRVIAHEYGHAWQGENCPFLQDPVLVEGFCEWVSYRVLGLLGAAKEQQRMLEAPGFYGAGLQRLLAVEATHGAPYLVQEIRRPDSSL